MALEQREEVLLEPAGVVDHVASAREHNLGSLRKRKLLLKAR
ncbi:MAG TPA: hypothetical protein VEL10_07975 [Gaiellaceae bacterium]|nr:hypothetical protein [Gaiellaceae bacterium]